MLPLPALQVDPYRGMTPHFRVAAARARALHAAVSGSARIIVASAAALLPRTSRARADSRRLHRASGRARRSSLNSSPTCSSTEGSRAKIPSMSTAPSRSEAASSMSFRRRTLSPFAWSSWATWSRRCAGSIPRRSDQRVLPITSSSCRRASASTMADHWCRSSISWLPRREACSGWFPRSTTFASRLRSYGSQLENSYEEAANARARGCTAARGGVCGLGRTRRARDVGAATGGVGD